MAEVYLARDTKLSAAGRAQGGASPRPWARPRRCKRFLFEARTTARFNHPHIVTVHAVGEHGERPYVALEYLRARPCASSSATAGAPLPAQEAVRIGLAIADALRAAHGNGVLHRDLKPENVMLTEDGQLRVLDFGLARVFHRGDESGRGSTAAARSAPSRRRTRAGSSSRAWGSILAARPPTWRPSSGRSSETTGATDVWALGVMLFEMLSARRPFTETTVFKLAVQVCSTMPLPVAGSARPCPRS